MLQVGNMITFEDGTYVSKLPAGVYQLEMDSKGAVFLSIQPNFTVVDLVGESLNISDLVYSHYNKTTGNFGIMLEGISGMGKTQTIKHIANRLGLPVILVNQPFKGVSIKSAINGIKTDCIIIFDEFEKVYAKQEESESLLSLFDGIDTGSRILFIVSANERRYISNYFFGRPGRFIFNFGFSHLSAEEGLDFVSSRMEIVDKPRMLKYLGGIQKLSYDICDKIISLISLHGEEVFIKNAKYFNVNPLIFSYEYEVSVNKITKMIRKVDFPNHIYFNVDKDGESIEMEIAHTGKQKLEKLRMDEVIFLSGVDFEPCVEGVTVGVRKVKRFESTVTNTVGY